MEAASPQEAQVVVGKLSWVEAARFVFTFYFKLLFVLLAMDFLEPDRDETIPTLRLRESPRTSSSSTSLLYLLCMGVAWVEGLCAMTLLLIAFTAPVVLSGSLRIGAWEVRGWICSLLTSSGHAFFFSYTSTRPVKKNKSLLIK